MRTFTKASLISGNMAIVSARCVATLFDEKWDGDTVTGTISLDEELEFPPVPVKCNVGIVRFGDPSIYFDCPIAEFFTGMEDRLTGDGKLALWKGDFLVIPKDSRKRKS